MSELYHFVTSADGKRKFPVTVLGQSCLFHSDVWRLRQKFYHEGFKEVIENNTYHYFKNDIEVYMIRVST